MSEETSMIYLESVVCRSSNILASRIEQDLVMMDIDQGMYYSLNPVGHDIWENLVEPLKVSDLCTQLQKEYAVDAAVCEADVLALLNDMASKGLIQLL